MALGSCRLQALVADITRLDTDAIVNAANEHLAQGGGVCGAIFRAAGADLQVACRKLDPCPTGEARITPGFLLPAKSIIHAVGPVWHGGGQGEEDLLASAYRSALKQADQNGCRSIAFPAISTGIFGFPLQAATDIAVKVVREHMSGETGIEQVVFACFSDEVLEAYRAEEGLEGEQRLAWPLSGCSVALCVCIFVGWLGHGRRNAHLHNK